jgi:hypothetical protein
MIFGGLFVVWLILTATTTVKRLLWNGSPWRIKLMFYMFDFVG